MTRTVEQVYSDAALEAVYGELNLVIDKVLREVNALRRDALGPNDSALVYADQLAAQIGRVQELRDHWTD